MRITGKPEGPFSAHDNGSEVYLPGVCIETKCPSCRHTRCLRLKDWPLVGAEMNKRYAMALDCPECGHEYAEDLRVEVSVKPELTACLVENATLTVLNQIAALMQEDLVTFEGDLRWEVLRRDVSDTDASLQVRHKSDFDLVLNFEGRKDESGQWVFQYPDVELCSLRIRG